MASQSTRVRLRVLIIDADTVVRDLVAGKLAAAGCDVDTLASGDGFSEDMIRLIQPDLILVDPFLKDVPLEEVAKVLVAMHQKSSFKLIFIDDTDDHPQFAKFAARCFADAVISKRDLLRAPADAAADEVLPEVELIPEDEPKPPALAAPTDKEIEFVMSFDFLGPRPPLGPEAGKTPMPPRRPSRPPPPLPPDAVEAEQPAASASAPGQPPPPETVPLPSGDDVLSRIQHEVGELPKPQSQTPKSFVAEINLFSRNNFYVGASGDLQTGGVFVATTALPEVGARVAVEIKLLSMPPLETEGVVEWVREANPLGRVQAGAGISLAHLPADWRKTLEAFLGERAPLTHKPAKPF